ncbi:2'-5' RNA ligase family protein [Candidatus Nomurabacteria bacterium]|nr:2'-5' RNA ligase family protein [Candidatus Nomurabacteria bacterium]MCB9803692.1 2'-5' RNA ligase family protein [Candidatus Nomurabacteria bacterium]
MNYFLGVFPDKETCLKISKTLAEAGKVFDNQAVPVNYVDRNSYHITLLFFGPKFNLIQRQLLNLKLRYFKRKSFKISVRQVRLGISRQNKELVFMPVFDGAEELRELVYDLSKKLGYRRDRKFIPHITLGRVRKDLSEEEYRNLSHSLDELNSSILKEIRFDVDAFHLVHSEKGSYRSLKKFSI